jgi:hypothetical protein
MVTFDLSNVEDLRFWGFNDFWNQCIRMPVVQYLAGPPSATMLKELILGNIVMNFDAPSITLPFCLPNLTKLILECVGLMVPLRLYFELPKLNHLTLNRVSYDSSETDDGESAPSLLFDKPFFQSVPKLEVFSIHYDMGNANEALVNSLGFCSCLQKLTIEASFLDEFIPSFLRALKDRAFLPNLAHLSIDDSWPQDIEMDYAEFIQYSRAERAALNVQGNGVLYYSKTETPSPVTFPLSSDPLLLQIFGET